MRSAANTAGELPTRAFGRETSRELHTRMLYEFVHDNSLYHALCRGTSVTADYALHVMPSGPGTSQEF